MTTAFQAAARTASARSTAVAITAADFQASTPVQRLSAFALATLLTGAVLMSLDRTADRQYDHALMAFAPAASQTTQVVVVSAPRARRA